MVKNDASRRLRAMRAKATAASGTDTSAVTWATP